MKWLAGIIFPAVMAIAQPVAAADLQVRVFERGAGVPLAGAAVCLGTRARTDQFGAILTDANGYAVFSALPQTELLVTAARPGYKSEQEELITSNTSRMLVISLVHGGGGPVCDAVADSARTPVLRVTGFSVQGRAGNQTVTLAHTLTAPATQYRASEHADFSDATWQDYVAAPEFRLGSGAGNKRVYFQVRRHSGENEAVVEILSPVVSASVPMPGN